MIRIESPVSREKTMPTRRTAPNAAPNGDHAGPALLPPDIPCAPLWFTPFHVSLL